MMTKTRCIPIAKVSNTQAKIRQLHKEIESLEEEISDTYAKLWEKALKSIDLLPEDINSVNCRRVQAMGDPSYDLEFVSVRFGVFGNAYNVNKITVDQVKKMCEALKLTRIQSDYAILIANSADAFSNKDFDEFNKYAINKSFVPKTLDALVDSKWSFEI